jgi:GNAT superfamily N-acetyltransferase
MMGGMDDALMLRYLFASLAGSMVDLVAQGSPRARVVEFPGVRGSVCPASPDQSYVNAVVAASSSALAAAYDELAGEYDSAGVRAWTVWVREGDAASGAVLADHGHVLDGVPRAMARELVDLPDRPAPSPAGLTDDVEPVHVGRINDVAYEHLTPQFAHAWTRIPPTADALAVVRGDEPVSVGLAVDGGIDAHLTGIATLPEHRGEGLAAVIVTELMRRAAARGRTVTTLVGTRAGVPVYERLGFRDLGHLEMWERRRT